MIITNPELVNKLIYIFRLRFSLSIHSLSCLDRQEVEARARG